MKNLQRTLVLIFYLCGTARQAQAADFFDDFNRMDVSLTNSGIAIGPNYVMSSASGVGTGVQFSISSGQLYTGGSVGSHRVLSYQGFQAENTAGNSFTTSVDITLGAYNTGINSGVAFNFQDYQNFYWARLVSSTASGANNGLLQFGQVVNGVAGAFAGSAVGSLNVQTGTTYNLQISSAAAGSFSYVLLGGTLNMSGNFTDNAAGGDFIGGYVGIYQNVANSNTKFDNLSVTTSTGKQLGLFILH